MENKKTRILFYLLIYPLIVCSFTGCKKDVVDSLFKNNSYIECNINGKNARGEGLRKMFEAPTNFHMNYSYYDDGSFTFNIDKGVNDKEEETIGSIFQSVKKHYRNWGNDIISRNK